MAPYEPGWVRILGPRSIPRRSVIHACVDRFFHLRCLEVPRVSFTYSHLLDVFLWSDSYTAPTDISTLTVLARDSRPIRRHYSAGSLNCLYRPRVHNEIHVIQYRRLMTRYDRRVSTCHDVGYSSQRESSTGVSAAFLVPVQDIGPLCPLSSLFLT